MKNKKGFTLIELLAVIVILAIIALIAVPVIMNIINKANKSAFKDTVYGVISAGELYFSEQLLDVNGMEEDKTFDFADKNNELQIKGELPQSGSMIVNKEGKVAIAASNGRYCVTKGFDDTDVTVAENVEDCKNPEGPKTLSDVAINLTDEAKSCLAKGTTCAVTEDGIMFTIQVSEENPDLMYNFYVIADDGNKVTLIMDSDLTTSAWYEDEADCSHGPITALNKLNELTDEEWSNIPKTTYTVSGIGYEGDEWIDDPSLRSYEDIIVTGRARMITIPDIEEIKTANNGTMPIWMFNGLYTTELDPEGNEFIMSFHDGYWTSTAWYHPMNNAAWRVEYNAIMMDNTDYDNGLRPVIELSK